MSDSICRRYYIATSDSIECQSLVYGSFVWEIHMRYNNENYYCLKVMIDSLITCIFNFCLTLYFAEAAEVIVCNQTLTLETQIDRCISYNPY